MMFQICSLKDLNEIKHLENDSNFYELYFCETVIQEKNYINFVIEKNGYMFVVKNKKSEIIAYVFIQKIENFVIIKHLVTKKSLVDKKLYYFVHKQLFDLFQGCTFVVFYKSVEKVVNNFKKSLGFSEINEFQSKLLKRKNSEIGNFKNILVKSL